jgi:hypothetical protein
MKHPDLCVEPMGIVASDMHKFNIFRMPDAREIDLKTSHIPYLFPWNVTSAASRAGDSTDDGKYATGCLSSCALKLTR